MKIIRIDFNEIDSVTFPGMDNGAGMMSARMYNDDSYRIIPTAIHPGGSIGNHKQNSGDDGIGISLKNFGSIDHRSLRLAIYNRLAMECKGMLW